MARHVCPNCGTKNITWFIDEEESPHTQWGCDNYLKAQGFITSVWSYGITSFANELMTNKSQLYESQTKIS